MRNIESFGALAILSAAAVFLTPVVHAGSSQDDTIDAAEQIPSNEGDNRDSKVDKEAGITATLETPDKDQANEAQRIITIHVKGLSCPFCVLGIEKRLKAIPSVETISSNWGKGEMYVKLKARQSQSDDELRQAIKRAGFTPGEIDRSAGEEQKGSR